MLKKTNKILAVFISTFLLLSTLLTNIGYAETLTAVNKDLIENSLKINTEDNNYLIISNELELNLKNKNNGNLDTITIPFTNNSDYNKIIESFNTSDYIVENFSVKKS